MFADSHGDGQCRARRGERLATILQRNLRPQAAERILAAFVLDEHPALCGTWFGISYRSAAYELASWSNEELARLLARVLRIDGTCIALDGGKVLIIGHGFSGTGLAVIHATTMCWIHVTEAGRG